MWRPELARLVGPTQIEESLSSEDPHCWEATGTAWAKVMQDDDNDVVSTAQASATAEEAIFPGLISYHHPALQLLLWLSGTTN